MILVFKVHGIDTAEPSDPEEWPHHGVCIYIKNKLNAEQLHFVQSVENTEYLWISFISANTPVFLCCCYHAPKPC